MAKQVKLKSNQPTGETPKAVKILRAAGRLLLIVGQFIRIVKKR